MLIIYHLTHDTDWYDNEHCPPRLTLDGWLIGNRYKSIDPQKPTWLTIYDLTTHEIGNSPEFQALMAPENTSEREKEIMSGLWGSQRALWSTQISSVSDKVKANEASLPGKYLLIVGQDIPASAVSEFDKWYREEHIPLLLKVPGWLRARRYKLESFKKVGQVEEAYHFIGFHDIDSLDVLKSEELKVASTTEWGKRLSEKVERRTIRTFELWKTFRRKD
jgi:hypothetical protein